MATHSFVALRQSSAKTLSAPEWSVNLHYHDKVFDTYAVLYDGSERTILLSLAACVREYRVKQT